MFYYTLAYGEWLIQKESSKDVQIHVMYDIACTLEKHLKVKCSIGRYQLPTIQHFVLLKQVKSMTSKISLAVPSFHSYGHSAL